MLAAVASYLMKQTGAQGLKGTIERSAKVVSSEREGEMTVPNGGEQDKTNDESRGPKNQKTDSLKESYSKEEESLRGNQTFPLQGDFMGAAMEGGGGGGREEEAGGGHKDEKGKNTTLVMSKDRILRERRSLLVKSVQGNNDNTKKRRSQRLKRETSIERKIIKETVIPSNNEDIRPLVEVPLKTMLPPQSSPSNQTEPHYYYHHRHHQSKPVGGMIKSESKIEGMGPIANTIRIRLRQSANVSGMETVQMVKSENSEEDDNSDGGDDNDNGDDSNSIQRQNVNSSIRTEFELDSNEMKNYLRYFITKCNRTDLQTLRKSQRKTSIIPRTAPSPSKSTGMTMMMPLDRSPRSNNRQVTLTTRSTTSASPSPNLPDVSGGKDGESQGLTAEFKESKDFNELKSIKNIKLEGIFKLGPPESRLLEHVIIRRDGGGGSKYDNFENSKRNLTIKEQEEEKSLFLSSLPLLNKGKSQSGNGDENGKGGGDGGKSWEGEREKEIINNEFCSACSGGGSLICCETCPKSFHFTCVDPPIDQDHVPDENWFCNECRVRGGVVVRKDFKDGNQPPVLTISGIWEHLINKAEGVNPKAFTIPKRIKKTLQGPELLRFPPPPPPTFDDPNSREVISFKRAESQPDSNINNLQLSPSYKNYSRERLTEEGYCHICNQSGTSQLLISCDSCSLLWHLDCLPYPQTLLPSSHRTWSCPIHLTVENLTQVVPHRIAAKASIAATKNCIKIEDWPSTLISKGEQSSSSLLPENSIRLQFGWSTGSVAFPNNNNHGHYSSSGCTIPGHIRDAYHQMRTMSPRELRLKVYYEAYSYTDQAIETSSVI